MTTNPLDKGKITIDDVFTENEKKLKSLTFISRVNVPVNYEEYNLPIQNIFLLKKWNKMFLIEKKAKQLRITLAATFTVTEVKECVKIYNDKSKKKPLKYYLVTLCNAKGTTEQDIEISNNSKSDFKQFQAVVNELCNGFAINMKEAEFKTFIDEYISPKVAKTVIMYTNAGLTPDGNILYENALAKANKILWADENGYIQTGERSYIKLVEASHYLPKLFKSNKSGQEIAKNLMTNLKECWGEDVVLPLLALGNMVMSLYYNVFSKHFGVPTLILYGETGTGKSTLVVVGLAIFGLSKEALTSGGSTVKSNEYFVSKYNCLNLGIDDVKGETLTSSNFTAFIKGIYQDIPRTKMTAFGKEVNYIRFCSPVSYSTNETLPDLKEVINRLNVIEIFGKKFKAENFKYHEFDNKNSNSLKELSLILPEFLKYSKDDVIKLYKQVFSILETNIKDTQKRIINNIAYAYTGALLLSYISGVEFENLQDKIIEFAKKQVENYDSIKTPVEAVLSGIVTLTDLGILEFGKHFKIVDVEVNENFETHIRFSKDVIISAINKFYSYDKTKKIDENSFLSYAKNHKRFRGNNHGVRYDDNKGKVVSSICFDISGLYNFVHISKSGIWPAHSYDEAKNYYDQCIQNSSNTV